LDCCFRFASDGPKRKASKAEKQRTTELDTVENRAEADTTARETKCRQLAEMAGLKLIRAEPRNPDLIDFGLYGLIDLFTGGTVHPMLSEPIRLRVDLEDVEVWLNSTQPGAPLLGGTPRPGRVKELEVLETSQADCATVRASSYPR
jgi:hypothetical protein